MVYFQNDFANRSIKLKIFTFTSHLQHSRLCRISLDNTTLAFGSGFYIRYNAAAHVVNSSLNVWAFARSSVSLYR